MLKNIVIFLITLSLTYFLSGADLFQKFMPRAVCMFHNSKLIMLHWISDAVICLSYLGIGSLLLGVYRAIQDKNLPFADFAWQFAGFIICCGLSHLMGVINLYVTYYWLDGLVKLGTAWFSVLVFIHLIKDFNKIRKMKTPEEFHHLQQSLSQLLHTIKGG